MMNLRKSFILSACAVSMGLNSQSLLAVNYAIQDLGTLGGNKSIASSINENGVIVGSSINANTRNVAFIYENKTMTELTNLPSTTFSMAYDINDSNVIVGSASFPYIYNNGVVDTINLRGRATDINNHNQVTGFILPNGPEPGYGFLYENGNLINFRTLLNSSYATASSINDNGEVIVQADGVTYIYQNGVFNLLPFNGAMDITNNGQILCVATGADGKYDICRYRNNTMEIVGDYNNLSTIAYSMNEKGYAVGKALLENVPSEPFQPVYDENAILMLPDGTIINLNDLKKGGSGFDMILEALDINEKGQIVGVGLKDGELRAFLMTPRGKWYN